MDRPVTTVCWLQEGARFEQFESGGRFGAWVPMRTPNGVTVHVADRRYCGCQLGWRGDTGAKVRVASSDLFDVVTVAAR